jgi:cathepsin B
MSDRVCIHSQGKINFHFSAENLVSCCWTCGFGCNGGFPGAAWHYWKTKGIVSGGPYGSNLVIFFIIYHKQIS